MVISKVFCLIQKEGFAGLLELEVLIRVCQSSGLATSMAMGVMMLYSVLPTEMLLHFVPTLAAPPTVL